MGWGAKCWWGDISCKIKCTNQHGGQIGLLHTIWQTGSRYNINIQMSECLNVWMYKCLNVWMYECTNGWMDEWKNGWMYECMNVWMYECKNVWI